MCKIGHYFELLGIEPTPYVAKMARTIENDGRYDADDYARYERAMDAICSRKPERMGGNGLEMLAAKVSAIADADLRSSAREAYDELAAECAALGAS